MNHESCQMIALSLFFLAQMHVHTHSYLWKPAARLWVLKLLPNLPRDWLLSRCCVEEDREEARLGRGGSRLSGAGTNLWVPESHCPCHPPRSYVSSKSHPRRSPLQQWPTHARRAAP